MAYLTRGNARIYYEETGKGEPVIACHGLIENTLCWRQVAEGLTKRLRFIAFDMRGHGRTVVEGEPYGFDVETVARDIVAPADRSTIAAFIRSFYADPDPMVEGLRGITCPTLVVYGEKDDLFIESSRLMASNIPGARLIEYKGVGHMSALEAPEPLARDILAFIESHPA